MRHSADADWEIELAPEFVCLSLNVCSTRGLRFDANLAALEQENNQ